MPIVQTITNYNQLYRDISRSDNYKDNFSYDGAIALMEYLDNLSDDCGMNIEYDPIAFCCEYSEYNLLESSYSYEETYDALGFDHSGWDEDIKWEAFDDFIEYLHERTQVINADENCLVIADF